MSNLGGYYSRFKEKYNKHDQILSQVEKVKSPHYSACVDIIESTCTVKENQSVYFSVQLRD